jgi:hypothetical protein
MGYATTVATGTVGAATFRHVGMMIENIELDFRPRVMLV